MSARILVVDDILPNVKLLEAKLRAEYYDVITANSGQEALDSAIENRPDLILLDVMMPGMDGYETIRNIRLNKQFEDLPVIAVTANAMPGDKDKCLEAGANDYLAKPIDIDQLLTMIKLWFK